MFWRFKTLIKFSEFYIPSLIETSIKHISPITSFIICPPAEHINLSASRSRFWVCFSSSWGLCERLRVASCLRAGFVRNYKASNAKRSDDTRGDFINYKEVVKNDTNRLTFFVNSPLRRFKRNEM